MRWGKTWRLRQKVTYHNKADYSADCFAAAEVLHILFDHKNAKCRRIMDFITIAKQRMSVRSYKETKVEPEKLKKILEAAHVAPTAANLQPVHLIAVQSEEGLAKIGKAADIYGAPLAIIVCADHDKAWVRPFDQKQTGDIDASILTDHMMLQATELGLGTVWVCYFKPDVLRKEFDLPANLEPVNILIVGYSDEGTGDPNRFNKQRIPMSQLVSYETL